MYRGLGGGVELPRSSDAQPDTDSSDCSLSGMEPMSIKGEAPVLNCGLLKGMVKVALVPVPRPESSVISPCIRSTSCLVLATIIPQPRARKLTFLQIVRPSPVPPNLLAVLESAWLNG